MSDLVTEHLWLVRIIAKNRMQRIWYGVEFDELLSYGTMGLIDAAEKYKPEMNYKFSTYAYRRIDGAITDGLRGSFYRCNSRELDSLDGEDEPLELESKEQLQTDRVAEQEIIAEIVRNEVKLLPERERFVIEKNDLEGIKQEEIGKMLNVSASMVSIIRSRGVKILRERLEKYRDFVTL